MNSQEFHQMMLYGKFRWPRQWEVPTDDESLQLAELVWLDALGDLDVSLIRAAMARWSGTWPPNPGELREAALDLAQSSSDNALPGWEQAWKELTQMVKSKGSYATPEWSHAVVQEAVDTLGYKEFCMSQTSDIGTWRAQFRQIYENLAARWRRESRPEVPAVAAWRGKVIEAAPRTEIGGGK